MVSWKVTAPARRRESPIFFWSCCDAPLCLYWWSVVLFLGEIALKLLTDEVKGELNNG